MANLFRCGGSSNKTVIPKISLVPKTGTNNATLYLYIPNEVKTVKIIGAYTSATNISGSVALVSDASSSSKAFNTNAQSLTYDMTDHKNKNPRIIFTATGTSSSSSGSLTVERIEMIF